MVNRQSHRCTGTRIDPQTGVEAALGRLQQRTALLPGYGFRHETAGAAETDRTPTAATIARDNDRLGQSVAGVVGGAITLALALLVGFALKLWSGRR